MQSTRAHVQPRHVHGSSLDEREAAMNTTFARGAAPDSPSTPAIERTLSNNKIRRLNEDQKQGQRTANMHMYMYTRIDTTYIHVRRSAHAVASADAVLDLGSRL
jgi:hypothetical protein